MEKALRIRLSNALLAVAGGAVLTFSLVFIHLMGQSLLSNTQAIIVIVVFWLTNCCLVALIGLGVSERFSDPSLTRPLMYWASASCFVALTLAREYHEILYFSLFTVAIFGVFRLSPSDFRRYTLFIISAQLTQSVFSRSTGISNDSWIEMAVLLIVLAAAFTIVYVLCQSVSRLRQRLHEKNHELQQALIAKDQFLANMSHELRTPMNGVLGLLDILQNTELNTAQKRYIDLASATGNTLISLINDILDYAKIKDGKLSLHTRQFSLALSLQKLVSGFYYQAQLKHIEVIMDIDPSLPDQVTGDEIRVMQIFNNLIANAVKFTSRGSVLIQVTITHLKTQDDNDHLRLDCSVSDTGIGIKQTALDKIFNPFTQENEDTTRDYGGTGLGLSIVKQLVMLMGGDIYAESEEGVGSTFTFDIKLRAENQLESNPNSTVAIPFSVTEPDHLSANLLDTLPGPLTGKEKLLAEYRVDLIDDLPLHQSAMQHYFEALGAQVTLHSFSSISTATSGSDDHKSRQSHERDKTNHIVAVHDWDHAVSIDKPTQFSIRDVIENFSTPESISVVFYAGEKPSGLSGQIICLEKPIDFLTLRAFATELHHQKTIKPDRALPSSKSTNTRISLAHTTQPILVVEDNEINQEVMSAMLSDLGLDFRIANNGAEAISILIDSRENAFAMILMDCQTPIMDGYTASRAIRMGEAGERHKNIPIIAITANALVGDREKCIDAGMDDYLPKPFDFLTIKTLISKYLTVNQLA